MGAPAGSRDEADAAQLLRGLKAGCSPALLKACVEAAAPYNGLVRLQPSADERLCIADVAKKEQLVSELCRVCAGRVPSRRVLGDALLALDGEYNGGLSHARAGLGPGGVVTGC